MKDKTILSLQKEIEKEGKSIDKEVLSDAESQMLEVPEGMDERHNRLVAEFKRRKAEQDASGTSPGESDWDIVRDVLAESNQEKYEKGKNSLDEAAQINETTSIEESAPKKVQIEEILSEEDRKALELGRQMLAGGSPVIKTTGEAGKVHRMPRKKKIIFALVAVLVLVCAFGMTSVGSRQYLKEVWDRMLGKQPLVVTSTEDTDSKKTDEIDAANVYNEIDRKLGISTVRPSYLPEKMYIKEFEIDTKQNYAKVIYDYDSYIITYSIYLNKSESSQGRKIEDSEINRRYVSNEKQDIEIREYKVSDSKKCRYVANYEYDNVDYQLKGIMNYAEFEEIVKKLNYL